jgi:hypothetical protein
MNNGNVYVLQSHLIGPPSKPAEKFELLVDLGIITVPDDYNHATWLSTFKERHQGGTKKTFCYYSDAITDENFGNLSRILKPGDELHVRVFQQIIPGTTTSKERMAFLAMQGAIYTGAQGASLVFEEMCYQLPKGKWYGSYDEPDRLCKGSVPGVIARTDGDFGFHLANSAPGWDEVGALLCFTEVE